jgi:hypothetical protein
MRFLKVVVVGISSWLFLMSGAAGQIPANVIDFDRSVGFSTPRSITVYPTAQGTDQVYLIPNGLQVADFSKSFSAIGITHSGFTKKGNLILRLVPTINGIPIPEIVSDLRARYPTLNFAYPTLKSSRFEVAGPGFDPVSVVSASADPIASDFVRSIVLPPIALRAMLTPRSYQLSILAVSTEYEVRGMSRDPNGKPMMEDRVFRVSTTVEGFCALVPGAALDASIGKSGCISPRYNAKTVRRMQVLLKSKKFLRGTVDGIYGESTENAIRAFQRANKLTVDGIPTLELLEFMEPQTP